MDFFAFHSFQIENWKITYFNCIITKKKADFLPNEKYNYIQVDIAKAVLLIERYLEQYSAMTHTEL